MRPRQIRIYKWYKWSNAKEVHCEFIAETKRQQINYLSQAERIKALLQLDSSIRIVRIEDVPIAVNEVQQNKNKRIERSRKKNKIKVQNVSDEKYQKFEEKLEAAKEYAGEMVKMRKFLSGKEIE